MATITPFPYSFSPISNISPFSYRDGATYLEILYSIRDYIVETLTPDLDAEMADLFSQFQAGVANAEAAIAATEANWDTSNAAFIASTNAAIAAFETATNTSITNFEAATNTSINSISNRVGPVSMQRVTLAADYVLTPDPLWPDAHPIRFQITQDATGGHAVTYDPSITGTLPVDPGPGAMTEFTLTPDGAGHWAAVYNRKYRTINVTDAPFFARGDGVADDTAALNAAIQSAAAGDVIEVPKGVYRTTAPVLMNINADFVMAGSLLVDHAGSGIIFKDLGRGTTQNSRHTVAVIRKTLNHTDAGSVGVDISGCYNQGFYLRTVSSFTVGVKLSADLGKGCVYNNIALQTATDNKTGILLYGVNGADDPHRSWPNQNTFTGGRISWTAASPSRTGYSGIQVGTGGGSEYLPNGNVFLNTSIEDIGLAGVYAIPVDCYGTDNAFYSIRNEGGLNPTFEATSAENLWLGGLYAKMSTIVDLGVRNRILPSSGGGKEYAGSAGKRIFQGSSSTIPAVSLYNSSSDNYESLEILGTDGVTSEFGVTAAGQIRFKNQTWRYGLDTAAPTTGTWRRGDRVWQLNPAASGNDGWVCVLAGTPGTWKTFGAIGA